VRKGSAFSEAVPLLPGYARNVKMFTVSKDTQALYITAVAKDRLPIFQSEAIKKITCAAIDEARTSCGFLLFAYVIMPDHLHILTDSPRKPSEVLRYIKGIISHRIISYLKENGFESSLAKLQQVEQKRNYQYSLWQHESNVFQIFSENMLMQKVNYIHQNPVRADLVERAIAYHWSSVRQWQNCPLDDEPLLVDCKKISWHAR
jgi:putative transposase